VIGPEVEVGVPTEGFAKIVGGHVLDLGSEGDGSFRFDGSEGNRSQGGILKQESD